MKHALHTATCTSNFILFHLLQALTPNHGIDGTTKTRSVLKSDLDRVLSRLSAFNIKVAHVYSEAFESLYDSVKTIVGTTAEPFLSKKALLHLKIGQRREVALNEARSVIDSAVYHPLP